MPNSEMMQREITFRRYLVTALVAIGCSSRIMAMLLGVNHRTPENDKKALGIKAERCSEDEQRGRLLSLLFDVTLGDRHEEHELREVLLQHPEAVRMKTILYGMLQNQRYLSNIAHRLPKPEAQLLQAILRMDEDADISQQMYDCWTDFLGACYGEVTLADEDALLRMQRVVEMRMPPSRILAIFDKDALLAVLSHQLTTLKSDERMVIERRFGLRGSPQQDLTAVGIALGGKSDERVRQIERIALQKLRAHNRAHPICQQMQRVADLLREIATLREMLHRISSTHSIVASPHFLRPISDLEFSVRTANCLTTACIIHIGELVNWKEADLLELKNFGRKSLQEVKEVLAEIGLQLGMDTGGSTI